MRKIAAVAILVVTFAWCGMAFAFQNEPEGFRDLKWGDPPTEDMVLFTASTKVSTKYWRNNEKLQLGNVELQEIVYCFYNNQFTAVFLHFGGPSNYRLLKTICRDKFGEPTEEQLVQLIWISVEIGIILDYDFLDKEGALMLANSRMLGEFEGKRKKKDQAKSAGEDW